MHISGTNADNRKRRTWTLIIAAAFLSLLVLVLLVQRDKLWAWIAGSGDMGAVDFRTLVLPSTPNSFLLCPLDICLRAEPNVVPKTYPVTAAQLRGVALGVWPLQMRVDKGGLGSAELQLRYVQRTAWMRFPDTVSIRFIPRGAESSTVAIYSRSLIGYSDLGANKARVERWIMLLDAELSPNRPVTQPHPQSDR